MDLIKMGIKAKETARYAGGLGAGEKNKVLISCANALCASTDFILSENEKDLQRADPSRKAFYDRLLLTYDRIEGIAAGLRKLAALDDPVNEVLYTRVMQNGLEVGEKRVPLGVVGIIYEARPNVTADSFGLCFKSGNSCILRGGTDAYNSNIAIVNVLQETLHKLGHPREIVQYITDPKRETARELMKLNKYVDVLIPRGGPGLIQSTVENSTVPVIETGVGNCHIFADESADIKMAVDIIVNAKTQRPSVCNACETLLVHKDTASILLPKVCNALTDLNVEIRGDTGVCELIRNAKPAVEEDWHEEFLDLILAVKIVENIDEAIAHIAKYSSGHTEAIITESYKNSRRFIREVDSAAVMVNASTRFTDGEEFGLGAEIGISTQKLHARGPMGLKALTTSKFIVFGQGQIR